TASTSPPSAAPWCPVADPTNPYSDLPPHCFWWDAMTMANPSDVDPFVGRGPVDPRPIAAHHKVATIGSCFAQHLSQHVRKIGLTYFVAEEAPAGIDEAAATKLGYGVFSARYGNVYTVRQALQV